MNGGARYRALLARDGRFDGAFFTGVRSTGVSHRPICVARKPLARNCTCFRSAAAAYDELFGDGLVRRTPYRVHWRLIFRHVLELMLQSSGFEVVSVEGGQRRERWTTASGKLFVVARAVRPDPTGWGNGPGLRPESIPA